MGLKTLVRILAFSAAAAMSLIEAALAHAMLVEASPRVGGSVAEAPGEISLTFTERVEPSLSEISLTGANGQAVEMSAARSGATPRGLVAEIRRPLAPGRYRVEWSVVSVDGHSTKGDFSFAVGKP
ncbi:MAG TPA: hypothetical protein DDZ68_06710 [Parvularcula sp.]|nr:hypothetical protein [Parvularcula sp.]HBS32951.1 hypothetical protein [Parvularcula sp.]HBS36306.1 hypothetical protein [Parvularcula sp.]